MQSVIPESSPSDAPALSVVIPVLNEAKVIGGLLDEVIAALAPGPSFEIVVVDDGSRDETPRLLADRARQDARVRPVRHRSRAGQSAAILSGVRAARAPVIATLDGDGQNDPADIPSLLSAFQSHPAPDRVLITGQRVRRRDTWLKRWASRIANGVRRRFLGDDTPDTGCGLKVFSRKAFLDMPPFDHMHRFLPALMLRRGGFVRSVAVRHRPRAGGVSNYGVWDRLWVGIVDLFGVKWLLRRALRPEIEPLSATAEARHGSPGPSGPPQEFDMKARKST